MFSTICTLFEGHYHYGVAALVNSLIEQGFTGPVYVGYKGSLPEWASVANNDPALNWPGGRTLPVKNGVQVHFLPIASTSHLTNHKPDFMLQLLQGPAKNTDAIFYLDPDIQVVGAWRFFEEWVSCGVALSEDFNSPLPANHPRRVFWRKYYGKNGIKLSFKEPVYANGGFIGVSKNNYGFLNQWQLMQENMAPAIGGLGQSMFSPDKALVCDKQEGFDAFSRTDQDALNAAVEAWDGTYSFIGKEAMGFVQGTTIIPHALSFPKPWKSKIILNALSGHALRVADRTYWQYSNTSIITYSNSTLKKKRLYIKIAAIIGRFYRRGAL